MKNLRKGNLKSLIELRLLLLRASAQNAGVIHFPLFVTHPNKLKSHYRTKVKSPLTISVVPSVYSTSIK